MRMFLTSVCKGDSDLEKILRLLRRFQSTSHLLGNPPHILVFRNLEEPFEGNFEEVQLKEERVVAEDDIIGIANDRARNIQDCVVFDPNSINTEIIRTNITVTQFEFKPVMIQLLQFIGQYS